jgi:hypothetical protein
MNKVILITVLASLFFSCNDKGEKPIIDTNEQQEEIKIDFESELKTCYASVLRRIPVFFNHGLDSDNIVYWFSSGDEIDVIRDLNNGWLEVDYSGRPVGFPYGYILKKLVVKSKEDIIIKENQYLKYGGIYKLEFTTSTDTFNNPSNWHFELLFMDEDMYKIIWYYKDKASKSENFHIPIVDGNIIHTGYGGGVKGSLEGTISINEDKIIETTAFDYNDPSIDDFIWISIYKKE